MSRTGFRGARRPKLSTGRRLSAIDGIRLDVLRGRGTADVRLASVGAEELAFGEFVATGIIRVTTDGCTDGESSEPVPGEDGGPFHEVRALQMFRVSGGERVLGRFAPEMLDSRSSSGWPVCLKARLAAWRRLARHARARPSGHHQLPELSGYVGAGAGVAHRFRHGAENVRLHRPCAASAPRGALLGRAGFVRPAYAGVRRGMRTCEATTSWSTTAPRRCHATCPPGRLRHRRPPRRRCGDFVRPRRCLGVLHELALTG
jgi:hypothetical protein